MIYFTKKILRHLQKKKKPTKINVHVARSQNANQHRGISSISIDGIGIQFLKWFSVTPCFPLFTCLVISDGKESICNAGDPGWIPGLGRSPGGGLGNSLQYSCLENPHRQRNLEDCSPWGCKELDQTEQLSPAHSLCRHWIRAALSDW